MDVNTHVKKILERAIKNKTFVPFNKIYALHKTKKIKTFVIISTKGLSGKSTSGITHIVNNLKNEKYNASWIRNTEVASKNSKLEDSFKVAMIDAGFDMKHWNVNKQGVYYRKDIEDKLNKGVCRVLFAYLNTYENYCSQNVMKADDIFFDEFIDAKFIMKDMSVCYYKLIKSLQRTNDSMVVMFANPHTNKNDIIVENGIVDEIDWESGKTQVKFLESLNTLICYIGDYENKHFKGDKELDKFFQHNEKISMFNKGILTNPIHNIIPIHKLKYKTLVPIFKYHIREQKEDTDFLVSKLDDTKLLIQQLNVKSHKNLRTYAFRAADLIPNGIFVNEVEYSYLPLLINKYKLDKVIFNNLYTEDTFKKYVLPKLTVLESIKKKNYVD